MAFSDYKVLDQVQKEFNIVYREENYLGTQPLELSQNFLAEMEFNQENIDVFDFELSAEQMKRIDDLNKDQRIGPDPDTFEG